MHQLPEMTLEEKVDTLIRDVGILLQAMRILGKALRVQEEIEGLTYSLEHRYSTEPGAE